MAPEKKKQERESISLPKELFNRIRQNKAAQEKKTGFEITMQAYVTGCIEKGMATK